MENPVPNTARENYGRASVQRYCDSDSHFLMALGVVLLVCGQAVTGRHEVTMIGLGLIIFSSLFS